jgi:Carboxypeptidase regulatory-like domain
MGRTNTANRAQNTRTKSSGAQTLLTYAFSVRRVSWISLVLLIYALPAHAGQAPANTDARAATSPSAPAPDPQFTGHISGKVLDPSGVPLPRATVTLSGDNQTDNPTLDRQTQSDEEGQFFFPNVPAGPFRINVTAEGFAAQTFSGNLASGDSYVVPEIKLAIATATTQVRVVPLSQVEIAEEQIKEEEKQRPLGFIPNFYVSYIPNAAPLTPKQKFKLAAKTLLDPVNFGLTAAAAGLEQASDQFNGYGQGAQGYAKRYGAAYADGVTGTLIGSAILPSLLKQDPRYFYKGTGTRRSRLLYALAMSVVCRGDNGRWQANYSAILGSLASGGISNLYYPAKDREGATLTVENTLIGIGTSAAANVLQEFVIRKLTPNLPNHQQANTDKTPSQISKLFAMFVHNGD